jgi:hypothetical protein
MSEKSPTTIPIPTELHNPNEIVEQQDKNGRDLYFGVDDAGKKTRLGRDSIIEAYGYDSSLPNGDTAVVPIETPAEALDRTITDGRTTKVAEDARISSLNRGNIGRSFDRTGMADMEAASGKKVAANEKARAIEKRASSAEVSALNDLAELSLYGSKGRTYTNPETGEVIADAANPHKGKLERILSDASYGKTAIDRKAKADQYNADIDTLLSDGFELTQAKLVMDLREKEESGFAHMTNELTKEHGGKPGLSIEEADKRVAQMIVHKDKKRLALVKDEGLMHQAEYDTFKAHKNGAPTDPADVPAPTDPADVPAPTDPEPFEIKLTPIQENMVKEAHENTVKLRNDYIELASKRRKLSFGFSKSSREAAIDDAFAIYSSAYAEEGNLVHGIYEHAGATSEQILEEAKYGWALESEARNIGVLNEETGNREGGFTQAQERLANNNKLQKTFNTMWTRLTAATKLDNEGNEVARSKKSIRLGQIAKVVAGVGAGYGVGRLVGGKIGKAAGIAGGALGAGAVLPALLAFRFAKGQAVASVLKNAEAGTQANKHNMDVYLKERAKFEESTQLMEARAVGESSNEKTKEYVNKNRIRQISALALGVTGAGLAQNGAIGALVDKVKDFIPFVGDNGKIPFVGDGGGSGSTVENYVPTGTPNPDAYLPNSPGLAAEVPDPIGQEPYDPSDALSPELEAPAQEIVGQNFNVAQGEGVQKKINDFLVEQGLDRNDSMSAQLLVEANEQLPGGLTVNSVGEGWSENIGNPGPNSWSPGVAEFMERRAKELSSQGSLPLTS